MTKCIEESNKESAVEFPTPESINVIFESEDMPRSKGVPIVSAIHDDGSLHVEECGLRRVVLQPSGQIAMELATQDEAESYVDGYNGANPRGDRWAESIDYVEAYRRGKAAGY